MKKNNQIVLLLLVLICLLHACKGNKVAEPTRTSSAVRLVLPDPGNRNDSSYRLFIPEDSADAQFQRLRDAVMADPGLGQNHLRNNIWQYIFRTNDLTFNEGDTWHIHKAYDAAAQKVCFILEVESLGHPYTYFKGVVDCPRICGYASGHLDPASATVYQQEDHRLVQLTDKGAAEAFMLHPQTDRAHTIAINFTQGIQYVRDHNASLVQIVYGNNPFATAPATPLFYALDQHGATMGSVVAIPESQVCIHTGATTDPHMCPLR